MSSKKEPKQQLLAAADALAFQSRKLRAAARTVDGAASAGVDTATDALLTKFEQFGEADAQAKVQARDARAEQGRAERAPYITMAHERLASVAALRAQYGDLLERLGQVDWSAVRERVVDRVTPGSEMTTTTRLALLHRVVDDTRAQLAAERLDRESSWGLRAVAERVAAYAGVETQQAAIDFSTLKHLLDISDVAASLRPLLTAVDRLLAALATDAVDLAFGGTDGAAAPDASASTAPTAA